MVADTTTCAPSGQVGAVTSGVEGRGLTVGAIALARGEAHEDDDQDSDAEPRDAHRGSVRQGRAGAPSNQGPDPICPARRSQPCRAMRIWSRDPATHKPPRRTLRGHRCSPADKFVRRRTRGSASALRRARPRPTNAGGPSQRRDRNGQRWQHRQQVAQALAGGGGGGDDKVLPLRGQRVGLGLVRVELGEAAGLERLQHGLAPAPAATAPSALLRTAAPDRSWPSAVQD